MSITEKFKKLNEASASTAKSIEKANSSIEKLNQTVFDGGKGFENIISSMKELSSSLDFASKGLGNLIGMFPGLGGAGEFISGLGGNLASLSDTVANLSAAYKEGISLGDSYSKEMRKLKGEMFSLTTVFGGTYEEAERFSRLLLSSRDIGSREFGFINPDELRNAASAFVNARISIEKLNKQIPTTKGNMDLLTAATLQAGASGVETSKYYSLLGNAILKQGLSTEDALTQVASFAEISEETGLAVESVASSLNDAASNFTQLGLSADFGRPLLLGFSRVLDDMNMGVENAIPLTKSLSDSLAGLATNYSNAFLISQRGGLSFGQGGGALSAGIDIQAAMIEAQRSGDEERQAEISSQLLGGLSETLKSFTGGQIITAEEASDDSSLATAYYAQTQILSKQLGIDEKNAPMTLQLLDDLEKAISTGDMDSQKKLEEQLNEQIKNRDANMDLLKKQNSISAAALAQNALQTEYLSMMVRQNTEKGLLNNEITRGLEQSMIGIQNASALALSGDKDSAKKAMDELSSLVNNLFKIDDARKAEYELNKRALEESIYGGEVNDNSKGGSDRMSESERALLLELKNTSTVLRRVALGLEQSNSGRNGASAAGGGGYPGGR